MEVGHIFPSRSTNILADVQSQGVFQSHSPLESLSHHYPSTLVCKHYFLSSDCVDEFYQFKVYLNSNAHKL